MLGFCLLTLPWLMEPALLDRAEAATPLVTCARPQAFIFEAPSLSAASAGEVSKTSQATIWLSRWERATRRLSDQGRTDREVFRGTHTDFNEHTLAAAEQLTGRVCARELETAFQWRVIEQKRGQVCLEAVPRDETDRLFFGAFQVWLNTQHDCLERLIVIERNQQRRTLATFDVGSRETPIELVQFQDEIPPAPRRVIRTADARTD